MVFDDTYKERLAEALQSGKVCIVPHVLERKEETIMKVTLTDGTVVEGTLDQIQRVAYALGQSMRLVDDGLHYNSSTKGLILISVMDTQHLRNALLKRYAGFVSGLKLLSNDRVAAEISNPSDKTLVGLMAEFSRRKLAGKL